MTSHTKKSVNSVWLVEIKFRTIEVRIGMMHPSISYIPHKLTNNIGRVKSRLNCYSKSIFTDYNL